MRGCRPLRRAAVGCGDSAGRAHRRRHDVAGTTEADAHGERSDSRNELFAAREVAFDDSDISAARRRQRRIRGIPADDSRRRRAEVAERKRGSHDHISVRRRRATARLADNRDTGIFSQGGDNAAPKDFVLVNDGKTRLVHLPAPRTAVRWIPTSIEQRPPGSVHQKAAQWTTKPTLSKVGVGVL
jgi:hypothetical protein